MRIIAFLMLFILSLSFVSAWHCADTDEATPYPVRGLFGSWGDDGFLGGTSTGFLDKNVELPDGCTGTKVWLNNKHTKFYYKDVVCQDTCDGSTLVEYYCDDRPGYKGETVMYWNEYADSAECGYNEVPEFGTVAAGLAIIGALGIFAFTRRH